MNKTSLELFCQQWLLAWTGNRPHELLAFYSEDAFYSDPARPQGLQGHQQLNEYFSKLLNRYPEWVWKPVEIFPTEKGMTFKWAARLNPDSQEFFGMDIVEIIDGKITRNEVYFNPSVFNK